MTTIDILHTADPPWLLKSMSELDVLIEKIYAIPDIHDISLFVLDGNKMRTLGEVFDEFSKKLQFPSYFGHNGAAFDECLSDLSWLELKAICIIVSSSHLVLGLEPNELSWLLGLLDNNCKEWSQCVNEGEAWDRDPVPFHVVFQSHCQNSRDLPLGIDSLESIVDV